MKIIHRLLSLAVLLIALFPTNIKAQQESDSNSITNSFKGRKLLIPTYSLVKNDIRLMGIPTKFNAMTSLSEINLYYSKIWTQAMEKSSFDFCPYEIVQYDTKQLKKSKSKEGIVLSYWGDSDNNWWVILKVYGPHKKKVIEICINGLDLSSENDIRLMMNMISQHFNENIELEQDGKEINRSNLKNKYKQNILEFYQNISNKTFLVPNTAITSETPTAELLMKDWTLCNYKIVTKEEILKSRITNDSSGFYWRNIPYRNGIITYNINMIISTKSDEVLVSFLGKRAVIPETIGLIQRKIVNKSERYKDQFLE